MKLWQQLGAILVENGILSQKTVERMISVSFQQNKRFATLLEDTGLATDGELAVAFARLFNLEIASDISTGSYPPELLDLIPPECATQNYVFPLRRSGDSLELAMTDPTNLTIMSLISTRINLKVVPIVATRKEIHAAICRHYLDLEVQEPTEKTILVVDDDLLIRTVLRDILAKAGYAVLTASDGLEALQMITDKKPDVIIADKVMPNFSGFEFCVSLKQMIDTRYIPIILISGQITQNDEDQAFDLGFFDYIVKPVKDEQLLASVDRAFLSCSSRYRFF
jgi:CheY-like chemotaxis protein